MHRVLTIAAAALVASWVSTAEAAPRDPVPVEYFAVPEALDGVALSPDGSKLALRKLPARDGNYILEVYDASDLTKQPTRFGASKMEIDGFTWLSDDYIWVYFRQQVRDKIEDVNQGVWEYKSAIVRSDGTGRWRVMPDDAQIRARLLNDPDHIIIQTANYRADESIERKSITDLSTPDWYKFNIRTGRQQLVLRGNDRLFDYELDSDGDVRGATEYDDAKREVILYTRDKTPDSAWREIYRYSIDSYETNEFIGFDPEDPYVAFLLANRGKDKTAVYEFDLRTGQFGEELYRRSDVDITGGYFATDPNRPGYIAGFTYYANGKRQVAFLDENEKALFDGVNAALPKTRNSITSRSFDGKRMTIFAQGPQEPGAYYLLDEGRLQLIGRESPLLEERDLGEERFITYKARDGRMIPGILTMPVRGEAPYPLVVLPHGGPWVAETRAYDEWPQVLANRGYMVLQPQYRGSRNYGIDHWTSSFGQWGYTMQDDKDDGALHLVKEGLADPARLAMFGWSYGGYSAFVASLRSPQIYKCAIAGAGVSDMNTIRIDFGGSRLTRPLIRTGYAGLSPVDKIDDVNIPILVIHGNVDQRVPIEHSDKFVAGLKQRQKDHKYVVLDRADHFSNTLTYEHRLTLYTELLDWLDTKCGFAK